MSESNFLIRRFLRQSFGIDLRTLALFRVAIAAVVLFDLAIRAADLTAHYTDWGVLPRAALLQKFSGSPWFLSLHLISGTVAVQALLFMVAALCALSLMAGYRTQVMTVASWFLLISLHNRNQMVLHGGDLVLRMLLFWGMFLPLGARFSFDNLLGTGHGSKSTPESISHSDDGISSVGADVAARATGRNTMPQQHASQQLLSIATLAALLQMCYVYWFAAALKSGAAWHDGTAVYYAFNYDQMIRPLGQMLLAYPNVLRQLTFLTMGLEWAGPVLACCPSSEVGYAWPWCWRSSAFTRCWACASPCASSRWPVPLDGCCLFRALCGTISHAATPPLRHRHESALSTRDSGSRGSRRHCPVRAAAHHVTRRQRHLRP
jgi:hypothetical protein